jgi:hypothetical protein
MDRLSLRRLTGRTTVWISETKIDIMNFARMLAIAGFSYVRQNGNYSEHLCNTTQNVLLNNAFKKIYF